MVRILQEIMPKRIRVIEREIMEEKKEETQQVHESKNRNTVIRNGLRIAKKSNNLLGEEKGKTGHGNVQMRSFPER